MQFRHFILSTLLVFLGNSLLAKVHYINKGTKYHIGDNRYALSEDSGFLDAHPVVGQEWIQAFEVSMDDKVRVHIDRIWGVDDCDYCKIIISIDDRDMLRLTQANNNEPIDTLAPLAPTLSAGRTHYLKIASYGGAKVDDFMIQDVWIETQVAEVKMLDPGPILKNPLEPMPTFTAPERPRAVSPCESAAPKAQWFYGAAQGKAGFDLDASAPGGRGSGKITDLYPGEAVEMWFLIDQYAEGDLISHSLEIGGEGPGRNAWVLSFQPGRPSALNGNLVSGGAYSVQQFGVTGLKGSGWNRLRLESCANGMLNLSLNGSRVSQQLPAPAGGAPAAIALKARGMKFYFSSKPEKEAPLPMVPDIQGLIQ